MEEQKMKILIETSARHVHVTEADLITLFGEGAKLTPKKDLSQPGQFACVERVNVIGPQKVFGQRFHSGPHPFRYPNRGVSHRCPHPGSYGSGKRVW